MYILTKHVKKRIYLWNDCLLTQDNFIDENAFLNEVRFLHN